MPDNIEEDRWDRIEKSLEEIRSSLSVLARAQRLTALGKDPVKSVWFDNTECRLYIPDALGDRIQTLILERDRFFEEPLLRRVQPLINTGDTVIDVGANIGNHSVFFAAVCGARVHAFEPQGRVTHIFNRNIELNKIADQVRLYQTGLGAKTGSLKIIRNNTANLGATSFEYSSSGSFPVKRLDDCEIDSVDFLKIDAEGMGHEVLKGGRALIDRSSPAIWIELYGDEIELATGILGELGYRYQVKLSPADNLFTRTEVHI